MPSQGARTQARGSIYQTAGVLGKKLGGWALPDASFPEGKPTPPRPYRLIIVIPRYYVLVRSPWTTTDGAVGLPPPGTSTTRTECVLLERMGVLIFPTTTLLNRILAGSVRGSTFAGYSIYYCIHHDCFVITFTSSGQYAQGRGSAVAASLLSASFGDAEHTIITDALNESTLLLLLPENENIHGYFTLRWFPIMSVCVSAKCQLLVETLEHCR